MADDDDEPVLPVLTGNTETDLRNLVRDACSNMIVFNEGEEANRWTRNWLERAKALGAWDGPTEGLIDEMVAHLDEIGDEWAS